MFRFGCVFTGVMIAGFLVGCSSEETPPAAAGPVAQGAAAPAPGAAMPGMQPGAMPGMPGAQPGSTPANAAANPAMMTAMQQGTAPGVAANPAAVPGAQPLPGATSGAAPNPQQFAQTSAAANSSGIAPTGAIPAPGTTSVPGIATVNPMPVIAGATSAPGTLPTSPPGAAANPMPGTTLTPMPNSGAAGAIPMPGAGAIANAPGQPGAAPGAAGIAGAPGIGGGTPTAPQSAAGTPEYSAEKVVIQLLAGDVSGLEEFISPKCKGLLGDIRDGHATDKQKEDLKKLFAGQLQPLGKPRAESGAKVMSIRNGEGSTITFKVKKEGEAQRIIEMSVKPATTKKR